MREGTIRKVAGLLLVAVLFFPDTQGRLHARNNQPPWGFLGGSDDKESACNIGHPGLIPGSGRSLEKEMATLSRILAMDRGACQTTVHAVTRLGHKLMTKPSPFNSYGHF